MLDVLQLGMPFEDYKNEMRNSMLTERVIRQEVGATINIPKAEVVKYYEEHKTEFVREERVFLGEIFLSTAGKDAAAVAASYGSISAVTFVTACTVLTSRGESYGGHMVACMALMESPAIVIAVLLLNWCSRDERERPTAWGRLMHEAMLNGPVFLLLGSMAVGMITGEKGSATARDIPSARLYRRC